MTDTLERLAGLGWNASVPPNGFHNRRSVPDDPYNDNPLGLATPVGEVEIETASGEIETDFPIQVTRHARDHMVGTIGNGVGRVAIETGSGDVRLLKSAN